MLKPSDLDLDIMNLFEQEDEFDKLYIRGVKRGADGFFVLKDSDNPASMGVTLVECARSNDAIMLMVTVAHLGLVTHPN